MQIEKNDPLQWATMTSRLDRIFDWEKAAREAGYRARMLAEQAGVTDRHMRRYFRWRFGLPPQAWIDELRLRKCKPLLEQGQSVKSVALSLGFKQVSHFSSFFKDASGMTPTDWFFRNKNIARPCEITDVRVGQSLGVAPY